MDENKSLALALEDAHAIIANRFATEYDRDYAHSVHLADLVLSLDKHLAAGGKRPARWELVEDSRDRRVTALEKALRDAIELAEEGWSYADAGYFRKKYETDTALEKLRAVLKGGIDG